MALAACGAAPSDGPAPREVVLARGAVLVAAPPGYCVDRTALRDAEEGSFALLASCASLDPNTDDPSAQPAILTVTVSGRDPETAPPRAEALAAAAPEAVLATRQRGALALVHLGDGGDAVLPGGDPRHWRGATGTGGRVVALALYAPRESLLAGDAGGDLMTALAARIEARAPAAAAAAPPPARSDRGGLRGALARLFN